MSETPNVPLVVRGELIEGDTLFAGRHQGGFRSADVREHLSRLPLGNPSALADLYAISLDEILDFLVEVGRRLDFEKNDHLKEAFALSRQASGLSESLLAAQYRAVPYFFDRQAMLEKVKASVGIENIEGWAEQLLSAASPTRMKVRAFGSRGVHIIAGNVPMVGVTTIIHNALTRSDGIIKTPSNDPLTSVAVARTMIDVDPTHPITRHLTVAYWKGGDEVVESALYDPRRIEKIVAWGGYDSVKHITKYLQPGIDLITLDPKQSATIIGKEAFADEETLDEVATRLALDIGQMNQEACVNARVVYVESGTDAEGLDRANRLGERTYAAIQALPDSISTPHKAFDSGLREEIEGLRFAGDDYRVIGGKGSEGALIVSQSDAPVDFAAQLSCRVGNIVPLDDLEDAILSTNAYTQTIGIYPDTLKESLRDRLAFQGAQRLVSLGSAVPVIVKSGPQDGIEVMRRMCKWVTDETTSGERLLLVARPELSVEAAE